MKLVACAKTALLSLVVLSAVANPGIAKDETTGGKMSTASKQDIINTLRERGSFHKMLDGLDDAYDLDNKLKGKGPYTVFAATDKAWAKINQADQDTLFGNKKKLAQVFSYEVIDGNLDCDALKNMSSVKTMYGGKEVKISYKKGDDKKKDGLYINNSHVQEADVRCSNGIIHIVDAPVMPALVE